MDKLTIQSAMKFAESIGRALDASQYAAGYIRNKTGHWFHPERSYAAADYPLGKNYRGFKKWSKRNPLQNVKS